MLTVLKIPVKVRENLRHGTLLIIGQLIDHDPLSLATARLSHDRVNVDLGDRGIGLQHIPIDSQHHGHSPAVSERLTPSLLHAIGGGDVLSGLNLNGIDKDDRLAPFIAVVPVRPATP